MNSEHLPLNTASTGEIDSGTGECLELLLVEGESASRAVADLCDPELQIVLPMQGKPLNAWKASLPAVKRYPWFTELLEELGFGSLLSHGWPERESVRVDDLRFDRVVLLFDPDADGIHCEALMLLFFFKLLQPLLEKGRVFRVRAPCDRFLIEENIDRGSLLAKQKDRPEELSAARQAYCGEIYAYSDHHAGAIIRELRSEGFFFQRKRYRGLAGIDRETLLKTCIDPRTRRLDQLTINDAQAAVSVFGGIG